MKKNKKFKNFSIKAKIILIFVSLTSLTLTVLGVVIFSNWINSAHEISSELSKKTNDEISSEIDLFLDNPLELNMLYSQLLANNYINMLDEVERERFFVLSLKEYDSQVYSFSFGTTSGEYYGARRNEDGIIEIMRNNESTGGYSWYYSVSDDLVAEERVVVAGLFDPRIRPWYMEAVEFEDTIFSPVYKHFIMEDLTVSLATPIYDETGELRGVLGTHMILANIDEFLTNILLENSGSGLIINRDTHDLIANSLGIDNYQTLEDNSVERMNISELDNSYFTEAFDYYLGTGISNFELKHNQETHYYTISEIQENGIDWLVISSVPQGPMFSKILQNIYWMILISVLSVLMMILVYRLFIRKIFRPVDDLVDISHSYAKGDFSKKVSIMGNNEFSKLSKALHSMAVQLSGLVNTLEQKVQDRTKNLQLTNQFLKQSEERLKLVMDNLPIGIAVNSINPKVKFEYINENFPKIYGVTREELEEKDFWNVVYLDETVRKKVKEQVLKDISSGDIDRMHWENIPIVNQNNVTRYISAYNTPIPNSNLYISSVIDVTDRKNKEISITYASNHDSLTGLPNRRYFQEQLLNIDSEVHFPLGIMMMDLNRLKLINDTYGHNLGDKALISVAKKLQSIIGKIDFVARLGGDEFALICPNTSEVKMDIITHQIRSEIESIKINDINLSMAVGYEIKDSKSKSIDKILLDAENKMYKDKSMYHYKKHDDAISNILEALKSKYNEEKIHSNRVSKYCKLIAQALEFKPTDITEIEMAGLYHDIGKIAIPDKILGKPGKLDDEEWTIMKGHTVNGYQILRSVHEYTNIAEYAMSHHERIDGKGYPNGLKGDKIPLFSRIISVADAYEAMTSDRVYRKALSVEEAINELKKHAGTQFDSNIVQVFIDKVLRNDSEV